MQSKEAMLQFRLFPSRPDMLLDCPATDMAYM